MSVYLNLANIDSNSKTGELVSAVHIAFLDSFLQVFLAILGISRILIMLEPLKFGTTSIKHCNLAGNTHKCTSMCPFYTLSPHFQGPVIKDMTFVCAFQSFVAVVHRFVSNAATFYVSRSYISENIEP